MVQLFSVTDLRLTFFCGQVRWPKLQQNVECSILFARWKSCSLVIMGKSRY